MPASGWRGSSGSSQIATSASSAGQDGRLLGHDHDLVEHGAQRRRAGSAAAGGPSSSTIALSPPMRRAGAAGQHRRRCSAPGHRLAVAAPGRSRRTARRARRTAPRTSSRPRAVKAVALGRVARRAVEQRADQLRRVQAHLLEGLVDEQLHHVQLVGGQLRDAPRERQRRPSSSSAAGTASEASPHSTARRAVERVAGQQQALGALEAEPVDPHRRRRRAPHARRRVADAAVLGADDQVASTARSRCRRRRRSRGPGRSPAWASATAPCRRRRSATSSGSRRSGPRARPPRPPPSTPSPSRCRSPRRTRARRRAGGSRGPRVVLRAGQRRAKSSTSSGVIVFRRSGRLSVSVATRVGGLVEHGVAHRAQPILCVDGTVRRDQGLAALLPLLVDRPRGAGALRGHPQDRPARPASAPRSSTSCRRPSCSAWTACTTSPTSASATAASSRSRTAGSG